MLPLVSHGANLFNLCPLPDWFPIGPAVWQKFPSLLNCWSHKTTQNSDLGYRGAKCVFSLCPFPDESTEVYQIWCKSVQPSDSFPRLLNLWPPNPPPRHAPWGIEGRLVLNLDYTHSQMCPQMWTKVGANRSSRLTAFPDLWLFDPLKPPSAPLCPLGAICLSYIHSQMNLHIWCQSDQPFESSPDFFICDPQPPPQMSRDELYLAYVHSQTNPQTCTKFGANRSSRLTASQTSGFVTP